MLLGPVQGMGSLDWHYLHLPLFSASGPAQMLPSKYGTEPHCGMMVALSLATSLDKGTATVRQGHL